MARALTHSLPSDSLEAAVRFHFGLAQEELARYLGVTRAQVAHLEAGRRQPTPATSRRLDELAHLLPPPEGSGPAAPPFDLPALPADSAALSLPDFGPLAVGPLRKRYKQVMAQAARVRWALHREDKGLVLQQRRQWGLKVLQAGLVTDVGVAASPAPDVAAPLSHRQRWLTTLAADVAAATPGAEAVTARALAIVRLKSLEAEAAALARLLAAT